VVRSLAVDPSTGRVGVRTEAVDAALTLLAAVAGEAAA
jgi:hypothetical protein